jgi:hypothetical protein
MSNLTLTITAAPELFAAMTSFTSAITAASVVTIPNYNSDLKERNALKEQGLYLIERQHQEFKK